MTRRGAPGCEIRLERPLVNAPRLLLWPNQYPFPEKLVNVLNIALQDFRYFGFASQLPSASLIASLQDNC
jgi:hypothetical protein